jgi:hypothetical protein
MRRSLATGDEEEFLVASGIRRGMLLLHVDLQGNVYILQNNQGDVAALVRPSPDGRHLVIQNERIEGNIWTVEDFRN